MVETDSFQTLQLINDEIQSLEESSIWMSDIQTITREFSSIQFVHVKRGGNMIAHSFPRLSAIKQVISRYSYD